MNKATKGDSPWYFALIALRWPWPGFPAIMGIGYTPHNGCDIQTKANDHWPGLGTSQRGPMDLA